MTTNSFASNLLAAGYYYDAARGGFVRGDTSWNSATQRYDSNSNVGGTVFVPYTGSASSGVSAMTSSANHGGGSGPNLPAIQTPSAIAPSTVGVSGTVSARPVQVTNAQWQAPEGSAFGVADVTSRDIDPFLVEDPEVLRQLDQQAQADLALGGSLSAQDEREAQQAARAAFAARGMAVGNPAVAAEILTRDQYSQQRLGERRAFAQGIAGMLAEGRRFNAGQGQQAALANADARLRAGMANQGTRLAQWQTGAQGGLQVSLANADAANRIGLANEANRMSAAQFNIDAALRASMANQSAGLDAARFNASNTLDYARLGIEGTLGQYNALTNRISATRPPSGGYAGIPQDILASRYSAGQYAAGAAAAWGDDEAPYRPMGTWGESSTGYRAMGS